MFKKLKKNKQKHVLMGNVEPLRNMQNIYINIYGYTFIARKNAVYLKFYTCFKSFF